VFVKICKLLREKRHLEKWSESDFTKSGVFELVNLAYSMNSNGINRRKTKESLYLSIK